MKSVSYAAALADTDALKASIATAAADVVYATSDLDGVIGTGVMNPARTVSVKTTANASTYTGHAIVVSGTDPNGAPLSETLTLTATNGGETIVGTKPFRTVTSIGVPAQHDTSGHFEFGVRDVMLGTPPKSIRALAAGDLKVMYDDGTVDTISALAAKETIAISPVKIFGDAATTVVGMSLLF